jgi:hypothetical protein
MKSKTVAGIVGALMVIGCPMAASAMPVNVIAAPPAPGVTLVSGGCGIGFHRGPWGGCRPNVVWRAYPGPRIYYRPAWHRAWGWRHVHRW